MDTKACNKCGEEKPLSGFYRHRLMADGRLNECKECKREYQRAMHHLKMQDPVWLEAERARQREKEAGRYREGRKSRRDPVKAATRTAVRNAVRRGDIVPADACEDCGHDFSHFRREAHHEDYDKPMEVEWLCSVCHGKRHRRYAVRSRNTPKENNE